MCSEKPPDLPLSGVWLSYEPTRNSCRSVQGINPSLTYNFEYEQCHSESDEETRTLESLRRAIETKTYEVKLLLQESELLVQHETRISRQMQDFRETSIEMHHLISPRSVAKNESPREVKLPAGYTSPRRRKVNKIKLMMAPTNGAK